MVHEETGVKSHPRRRVLQNISLQLLHKHQVVEDNNGVILSFPDQHTLEGLENRT